MNDSEIIKISNIDPGELLLEAVKNAEHITPEMQRAIAEFMAYWATPQRITKVFKSKLFGKDI